MGSAWLNSRQIEAARRSITNYLKREGKLWIRVFPTSRLPPAPPELTMGGGKGSVDHYVMVIRPGRIIFEMDGADPAKMKEALSRAGHKLPFKSNGDSPNRHETQRHEQAENHRKTEPNSKRGCEARSSRNLMFR
jgi:ribosomal protein L16